MTKKDDKQTDNLAPRKRGQQKRSRAMIEKILLATKNLLTEDGLDGLTTSHVAKRAGISVGSLYQYFPNKQSIIQELYTSWLRDARQLFSEFDKDISEHLNFDTVWEELFEAIYSGWDSEFDEIKFTREMYKAMAMYPELRELDEKHGRLIADMIANILIRGGSPMDQDRLRMIGLYVYSMHNAFEELIIRHNTPTADLLELHKNSMAAVLQKAILPDVV